MFQEAKIERISREAEIVTIGKNIPALKVNKSTNKYIGADFYVLHRKRVIIISVITCGDDYERLSSLLQLMLYSFALF